MRPAWVRAAAVCSWLVCVLLIGSAQALVLAVDGTAALGNTVMFVVSYLVLPTVGMLIAYHRPGNPIGWLMIGVATVLAVPVFAEGFDTYAAAAGGMPGQAWAVWLSWAGVPGTALLIFILLLFPTGRLVSVRWRPVVWVTGAGVGLSTVGETLAPGGLPGYAHIANPMPLVLPATVAQLLSATGQLTMLVGAVAAVTSLVVRFHRGDAEVRAQLKWVVYAGGLLVAELPIGAAVIVLWPEMFRLHDAISGMLIFVVLPGAVGIAILRHRLLDIDVLVWRTLSYGMLWLLIAVTYLGAAAALGIVAAARLPLTVAILATIAVTIALEPIRRRLGRLAERMVHGDRDAKRRELERFGAQLADSGEPAHIARRLAECLLDALELRWVRVELRERTGETLATEVAGDAAAPPGAADASAVSVPLAGIDGHVGVVDCTLRHASELAVPDRELISRVGRQAALAARNAALAAELERRLDQLRTQAAELAESRARLVHAQDAERRRIERNIHDGAQQQLVALLASARAIRNRLNRDADSNGLAMAMARLQDDIRHTLAELRELASGIHPAILTDNGLAVAVEDKASRAPIPVQVFADPALRSDRLAPDTEVTAYFVATEALANVLKHAAATAAKIELTTADGMLLVRVRDDGVGIGNVNGNGNGNGEPGRGLANLRDRVTAIGGTLEIDGGPVGGTVVTAALPLHGAHITTGSKDGELM